jgi:hypothetical protein
MEIDLSRRPLPEPVLPSGFEWRSWHPIWSELHARAKWISFRDEMDSRLFPCLSQVAGCRRLVRDISHRWGFVPDATWLVVHTGSEPSTPAACGTIQGCVEGWRVGAIQNIGVVPECRGLGIGRALLVKSLTGFHLRGVRRVRLEVTDDNSPAVELYRSVGFVHTRTSYRAVELEGSSLAAT